MPAPTDADIRLFHAHRDAVRRAPTDADGLIGFAFRHMHTFLEDVVRTLEEATAPGTTPEPAFRLRVLGALVSMTEYLGRTRAGLSANGDSVADTYFRFSRDHLETWLRELAAHVAAKPTSRNAHVLYADALLCAGRVADAEVHYAHLRQKPLDDTGSVTSFDPAFHRSLPEALAAACARLPEVSWIKPPSQDIRRLAFVSGDLPYFEKFGWTLVHSFRSHAAAGICLALHVMDATEEEAAAINETLASLEGLTYALSVEWTGLRQPVKTESARSYAHAIRYLRFHQLLAGRPGLDAWIVDMDTAFNRTPEALFALLANADVALTLLPVRLESRNKVLATAVGVRDTMLGRDYLARSAGYMAAWYLQDRLVWGVDQVALYAALIDPAGLAPGLRVRAIPPSILGANLEPDTALWSLKIDAATPPNTAAARIANWSAGRV